MTTENFTKQIQDGVERVKSMMPQVTFNKTGFEIRYHILELAQTQLWQDYLAKWGQYTTSIEKDNDTIVTKVEMPAVPGAEEVLKAAEKFYSFVKNKD